MTPCMEKKDKKSHILLTYYGVVINEMHHYLSANLYYFLPNVQQFLFDMIKHDTACKSSVLKHTCHTMIHSA